MFHHFLFHKNCEINQLLYSLRSSTHKTDSQINTVNLLKYNLSPNFQTLWLSLSSRLLSRATQIISHIPKNISILLSVLIFCQSVTKTTEALKNLCHFKQRPLKATRALTNKNHSQSFVLNFMVPVNLSLSFLESN